MRPRLVHQELRSQIDAFAAPGLPHKPRPQLIEPSIAAAGAPQELWVGVYLPQFAVGPQDGLGDERRRGKLLERLAMSAQQFTPRVSLAPPDGLLLEVRGSLNLFGGADGLCHALTAQHRSAGIHSVLALAPTPLAALVCARAGSSIATERTRLVSRVAPLALATLRWPEKVLRRLAKIGVYTIGQALRLPRAGFARRFGVEQLASLDRLIGRSADPQAQFRPHERFHRRCELTYELEDQALILKTLEPLLQELERFLQVRQCGVTRLECRFRHRHQPPTLCLLKLAVPTADAQRLRALLGEKLMALVLPEPVRSCELRTGLPVPRALASSPMWQPGEQGGESGAEASQLVEHLRARLGDAAVYGLQLVADHRPERMWRIAEPGVPATTSDSHRAALRRPFWLLPVPQLLAESAGLPRYRGPLRFSGTPERIETGWWDYGEVRRDYYTALDASGVRLWIFRERGEPHRWFLHGMFG